MFHRSTRTALLAALPLLAPLALMAQGSGAALVRDIDTLASPTPSASPSDLITVGGKIFFLANGRSDGHGGFVRQLAVSDGTAAGTELLADPCDGAAAGCKADPQLLGGGNGVLFYTTQLGGLDTDLLWRSDGTRSGTYPLTGPSLFLDRPSDEPGSYALAGGRLFFSGCANGHCSLWVSDGTVSGTRLLQQLSISGSGSLQLTPLGNRAFFFSRGDTTPLALWVSDGTAAGTRIVHVFSGLSDIPQILTAAAGRLFFIEGTDDDGDELWTSDGTASGTRAVTAFEAPSPFLFNSPFKVAGGSLYFVANDVTHGSEIWVSDGTPAGTRRVTEFGFDSPFPNPPRMAVLGSRLVFFATDGLHPMQLWSTTGTPESTAPVAEISPQPDSPLVAAGSRLLFVANDPTRGTQVWTTDGTASGTRTLLSPCAAGACGSASGGPVAFGGAAFFLQRTGSTTTLLRTDGTPAGTHPWSDPTTQVSFLSATRLAGLGGRVYFPASDPAHGEELWSSDGHPDGARLVADLQGSAAPSNPDVLTALGDRLFFTASDGHATTLWQSTGTEASTQPIPLPAQNLTAASGLLFFTVRGTDGKAALWRTDGTVAGTLGLTSGVNVLAGQLTPFSGKLVFAAAQNGVVGLWQSDGTPAGTTALVSLPSDVLGITSLTSLGGELYFIASTREFQFFAWRSDGTASGTRQVSDPIGGAAPHFTRLGTAVFFLGFGPDQFALFRTDGTPGGTVIVHQGRSFDTTDISDPVVFGDALYFFAPTDTGGRGLWRTDGTEGGTALVLEITPEIAIQDTFNPPPPAYPVVAFGKLFFVADDGVHGRELWQSDGTAPGTTLFADLFPGIPGSEPSGLTLAGGRLYFSANDGAHGRELWRSDGTATGTRLVADAAPGGESSAPLQITAAGGRLYWNADDGLHGRELWSLPLGGSAGCSPADTRLCLAGGRFQVEIAWKDFQGNRGVGHAVPLTADTGYFWFFADSNVEAVVKVLDARSLNQAFWVFYGALSSVEYTMTVTDTQTGLTRRYFNPSGNLASVGDTHGFGPLGASDSKVAVAPGSALPLVSARTDAQAATGSCTPGPAQLCLQSGRFAVTAAWKDFQGHTGTGTAVSLTGDTGYFWFFSPTNVEVILKVLDGRPVNEKFWVFYGALSNVEYTLTVTDTQTGAVKTYKNPSGQFGSVADTGAF